MESSSSAAASAPPLAHAIGGSVGSALALLLLYPLERLRIELQAQAARHDGQSLPVGHVTEQSADDSLEDDNVDDHSSSLSSRSASSDSSSDDESWTTAGSKLSVASRKGATMSCHQRRRLRRLVGTLQILLQRGELYNGASGMVTTLATSNFVFFYTHAMLRSLLQEQLPPPASHSAAALRKLAASCGAGMLNVIVTNPIWVTNLRMVTAAAAPGNERHHQGVASAMLDIVRSEGWRSLWNGTSTSLLLVSNPVIQFFLYEQLKTMTLARRPRARRHSGRTFDSTQLLAMEAFVLGALAKAVATVATYPLQLSQSILRLQKSESVPITPRTLTTQRGEMEQYGGTWDCLVKVRHEHGWTGLFQGLEAKLLQTVLTAAFTFLTYEHIVASVGQLLPPRRPLSLLAQPSFSARSR